MTRSQLARRQALLARSDRALERWPRHTGATYTREMRTVGEGLEALAQKADTGRGDRLERARTWRYAAHTWLELGTGGDIECLERAQADLDTAESLLAGCEDLVERMKLDAGYGHVLRHLARARVDPALLREARRRLASALTLAHTAQPEAVQPLQAALANTDSVLPLAEEVESLGRRIDALRTEAPAPHEGRRQPVGAAEAKTWFDIVERQFEKQKGSLDSVTRDGLQEFLARLGTHIEGYTAGRTLEDSLMSRQRLGELIDEFQARVKRPSLKGPGPPPGSRGERVLGRLQELKVFVLALATDAGAAEGTREAARELFVRLAALATRVNKAGAEEEQLRKLEVNEARGLASEVRLLARRQHLTFARPVWTLRNASPDVNRVFFSGSPRTRAELEATAAGLGLEVNHPAPEGADFAERRWQDLRTASLAVFDLSGGQPQVYYELGIALTLGTELLLIAREGTLLPFDVAQNVHLYSPLKELRSVLAEGLDATLYGLQVRGDRDATLSATLRYAERLSTVEGGNALVGVALQSLRNAGSDPVKFLAALATFNRFLGPREHEVLFPRWPGAYPDPQAPRCFVIMPFRAELDRTYSAVARAAKQAGVEPLRGDLAEGQQIIGSIWNEICLATHAIVDLTGLNLNVCLELGIVHTLGRPTLLIGQEGTERGLHDALPGIAKWRCHTYQRDPGGRPDFIATLSRFLETGGYH